jgi:hypothetical protein
MNSKFASIYLQVQSQANPVAPKLLDKDSEFKAKAEEAEKSIKKWLERRFENVDEIFNKALRAKRFEEATTWQGKWIRLDDIRQDLNNFSKKRPVWMMGALPKSHSDKMKDNKTLKNERYPWPIDRENKDLTDDELKEAFSVSDIQDALNWAERNHRTAGSLQWILQAPYYAEKGMTEDEAAQTKLGLQRFRRYTGIAAAEGWTPKSGYYTKLFPSLNSQIQEWINNNIQYDKNTA